MRTRSGCQSCRDRHLKCTKVLGSEKCQRCCETKRACVWKPPIRFRHQTSTRAKNRGKDDFREDFTCSPSQIWVDIPSAISFVTPQSGPGSPKDQDSGSVQSLVEPEGVPDGERVESFSDANLISSLTNHHESIAVPSRNSHGINNGGPFDSHYPSRSIDTIHDTDPALNTFASPTRGSERTQFSNLLSHETTSPENLADQQLCSWPFKDVREARLLSHYIRELSPQIDVLDKYHRFGRDVPKRVANCPVIANAIYALASRHISLVSGSEDMHSSGYLDTCLQILIVALEDPLGHWDENLLIAVIILRSHEEMSDNDERCHLFGTSRILNSIAAFAADGGLRESASWISLRQHIYISLTSQQPLDIDLSNYHHSGVFKKTDDESWANRIVFIFAKILTHVFQPSNNSEQSGWWGELQEEVESWNSSKPWSFTPMWAGQSPGGDGEIAENSMIWPEMLMMHPTHVVALQYLSMSKIILSIYDPRLSILGFAGHRFRRESEKTVVTNLRLIVGLAISNEHVTNAMFQACHTISACGSYLSNEEERAATVDYLINVQAKIGWRTSHIIAKLRQEWQS